MAGIRDDGSPPPQDLLDSSPSEIKLFLGTQVPGGQEVTVSRAALESLSPVFKKMLTVYMMERIQGQVILEYVSMETWNVISGFYFSGKDLVCKDNVMEVVPVADMYELTKLKDHCDVYLSKNTVFDDFVEALNWASTFALKKLKEKSLKKVKIHFMDHCQSESFLGLNKDWLLEILRGPYVVADELTVCLAVLRWVEARNADSQTVEQLFQHLKLYEVCLCCLEKHVADSQNAAVRDVVHRLVATEKQEREKGSPGRSTVQYFRGVYGPDCRRLYPKKAGKSFSRRCTCEYSRKHDLIFIRRSEANRFSLIVDTMDVNGKMTASSPSHAEWRLDGTAACIFDNCLVLTGGQTDCCSYFYDFSSRVWTRGPRLLMTRYSNALVSMGDAMYAVMGLGENSMLLPSIETYSIHKRKWLIAGHMQHASTSVSAASLGSLILAYGITWGMQNAIQSFNTETKVAVVLKSTPKITGCFEVSFFGFDGAFFVHGNDTTTMISFSGDGELSFSNWGLLNVEDVFEEGDDSCTDTQSTQKTQVPYLVQHDLTGMRANLMSLPSLADRDVLFLLRP